MWHQFLALCLLQGLELSTLIAVELDAESRVALDARRVTTTSDL